MRVSELLDEVQVKNRVVDAPVTLTYDLEEITWAPGQTRHMPKKLAEWFVAKSWFKFNSDTGKRWYKLVILGKGQDESDLTAAEVTRPELLDRENMRSTAFDKETGEALRPVYLDPNGVSGVDDFTRRADNAGPEVKERSAKQAVAEQHREEAREMLGEAAAKLSPEEIRKATAAAARSSAEA